MDGARELVPGLVPVGLSAVVVVPAHKILLQLSGGALAWLVGGGLAYRRHRATKPRESLSAWSPRVGVGLPTPAG